MMHGQQNEELVFHSILPWHGLCTVLFCICSTYVNCNHMPHLILLICIVYLSSAFFTSYFYFSFTFIKVLWFMFQIADKL